MMPQSPPFGRRFQSGSRSCAALALGLAVSLTSLAAPGTSVAQTAQTAQTAQAVKKAPRPTPAAVGANDTIGGRAPADSDPMTELKKSELSLRKTLAKQAADWSPEKDVKDSEIRKMMTQLFDFEELGRRALVKHWDGLTPKQRSEFVATFRDLVERSYLRQIHGRPEYELKFLKQTREGDEATVTGQLNTVARGKKVQVDLDYRVHWNKGRWMVFDVVTDEQSLLDTYRAEFNKIINKESFDALLKRMKKKLDDKPAAAEAKPAPSPTTEMATDAKLDAKAGSAGAPKGASKKAPVTPGAKTPPAAAPR